MVLKGHSLSTWLVYIPSACKAVNQLWSSGSEAHPSYSTTDNDNKELMEIVNHFLFFISDTGIPASLLFKQLINIFTTIQSFREP